MWVGAMHTQDAGACEYRYIYVAFVLVFISLLRIAGRCLNPREDGLKIGFLHSVFALSAVVWSSRIPSAACVQVL